MTECEARAAEAERQAAEAQTQWARQAHLKVAAIWREIAATRRRKLSGPEPDDPPRP